MLKLSLLTEDTNKPATRFEQNVVKVIHNKFIYYDLDIGRHIMEFLKDYFALPYKSALEIYYLYNNNLPKISREDDSWVQNPDRGYGEETSAEEMVLAKHLEVPPNFLTTEHTYYQMAHFQNEEDGHLYAVGDEEEVTEAIDIMANDMFHGVDDEAKLTDVLRTEYVSLHGENSLTNYIFIAESAIHEIAKEDANREIEDWYGDSDEILSYAIRTRPDIEKEWGDLLSRRDDMIDMMLDTDNENEADHLKDKIDELNVQIDDLAEWAAEEIADEMYVNNIKWMKEDPLDWLHEFDYIGKSGNQYDINRWGKYYDGYNREEIKYPEWILVDVVKLVADLIPRINEYRAEEFARYDGVERTEEYNGETFYIYKTE
jgi:hypothetical protein